MLNEEICSLLSAQLDSRLSPIYLHDVPLLVPHSDLGVLNYEVKVQIRQGLYRTVNMPHISIPNTPNITYPSGNLE